MLERLRPLVGARDARVGRLRFFLLIASTSFWSATICDTHRERAHVSIQYSGGEEAEAVSRAGRWNGTRRRGRRAA